MKQIPIEEILQNIEYFIRKINIVIQKTRNILSCVKLHYLNYLTIFILSIKCHLDRIILRKLMLQ